MSENQHPAPEPAGPGQPAQPDPPLATARPPAPAMPVIRPGEMYDGPPHPLVDGVSPTIGWQKQPEARGGPVFVIIARTRLGTLRAAGRFPLTEDGWDQAWQALVKANPVAAGKAWAVLAARAASASQPGGPPPPYLPTPIYPPARVGRTSRSAVASLVLGIIALPLAFDFGAGIIFAIPAVILGLVALGTIRQTGAAGRGLAIAGLTLGIAALAFAVFVFAVLFVACSSPAGC